MKRNRNMCRIYLLIVFAVLLRPVISVSQVTVDTSGFITIKPNTTFFVDGTFTIKSGLENSGHFADQTNGNFITINDDVSIERYLTANMWHNCASPVSNNQSTVYTGTDLIFYYDETIIENDWNFGWVMHDGALNAMRGYDVYLESPVMVTYSGASSAELNTGGYSINVTRTNPVNGEIESRKGWNLLGNPYPSPVDWLEESGWEKSPINDAKYIWDHKNLNYTIFIGGDTPVGINGGTQYIPANQGFWVQAMANGTVQVNNTARVGQMSGTPGYYKNSRNDYPFLCLKVEAEGFTDETAIRFLETATMDFDVGLDAYSFLGRAGSTPRISTLCGNDKLDINTMQCISDRMEIPLAFSYGGQSVCTLKMTESSTLCSWAEVYIKDFKRDIIINLDEISDYSFFAESDDESRFRLYINPSDDIKNNINKDNAYSIYAYDNLIYIIRNTAVSQVGQLTLFNVYGNVAQQFNLPDCKQFCQETEVLKGCYIAQVKTKDFLISKKIWID